MTHSTQDCFHCTGHKDIFNKLANPHDTNAGGSHPVELDGTANPRCRTCATCSMGGPFSAADCSKLKLWVGEQCGGRGVGDKFATYSSFYRHFLHHRHISPSLVHCSESSPVLI